MTMTTKMGITSPIIYRIRNCCGCSSTPDRTWRSLVSKMHYSPRQTSFLRRRTFMTTTMSSFQRSYNNNNNYYMGSICMDKGSILKSAQPQPTSFSSFFPSRTVSSSSSSSSSTQAETQDTDQKLRHRLDVAIVGAPNAGKSQLLNMMTQSNVAAVSRKRHTTRDGILGARTFLEHPPPTQLVFIDTPGFLRLKDAKDEGLFQDMLLSASNEMKHADYTLLVIDAARTLTEDLKEALITLMLQAKYSQGREEIVFDDANTNTSNNEGLTQEEQKVLSSLGPMERFEVDPQEKFAIVLNKVDLVQPKKKLLDIATEIGAIADEVLMHNNSSQNDNMQEEQNQVLATTDSNSDNNDATVDADIENGQDMNESSSSPPTPFTKEQPDIDMDVLAEISPPIFYVSALENDGVDDILRYLKQRATPSRYWTVEAGEVTDQSPLERVEEIIREKIYRCLHKEVPHQVTQVNRTFQTMRHKETGQRGMRIHQDLVVKRKSHQRLVMGRAGKTLQRIQEQAQRDIEKTFGEDIVVSLHLHARLRKSQHDEPLEASEYGMQHEVTWDDLRNEQ